MIRHQRINNKAFSMIELMVVVAIIGVLAAIGIPEYSKFQAKARQSEAKLSLAALFTAEESFRQQFNTFSVDLVNVGFSVQGQRLRYLTGFQSAEACTGYPGAPAPTENTAATNTWSDGTNVNLSGATWALTITKPSTTPVNTSCSATAGTFLATAYGTPATSGIDPGANSGDTWTINQNKLLTNTQVYLGQ